MDTSGSVTPTETSEFEIISSSSDTLEGLRALKNSLIGNPVNKVNLIAQDPNIDTPCIRSPSGDSSMREKTRIEAAHLLSSLSYGPEPVIRKMLDDSAPGFILDALLDLGPSTWGAVNARDSNEIFSMGPSTDTLLSLPLRSALVRAFNRGKANAGADIQKTETLDVILPFLVDPSNQVRSFIAQLLGTSLRTSSQRRSVANWMPIAERLQETKGKRGWERAELSSSTSGAWTAKALLDLIKSGVFKTQEAALEALASLAKGNQSLSLMLCTLPLETDRSTPALNQSPYLVVANLYSLVSDDKDLQRAAFVSGTLKRLASLVLETTPQMNEDWNEDGPEATSLLLEAALTAIASLTLHLDDNRVALLDEHPTMLHIISRCLSHPYAGVRYGACQCVRALSRSVKVLRTGIGDSKLAEILFNIVKTDSDERVILVALMGIANMVNDFSPTRKNLIESGVISKLSEIIKKGDEEMKTNSIWALRNALRHSSREEMESIMNELGWDELARLSSSRT
ncbi:armadillo-type protein [Cantharellus anzutake]|uniref:armadillo-type protein n=1 Tax=Cantharellus anzutake TaxID=1750568 RepID=UPI0019084A43|nr:armadillo-type protein [Cantharellus anzutake]KAF8327914.1 armadillo-type protein [Cantharellus anzutake]